MFAIAEPKLAPPGAGLPSVELLIGRLMFALNRWTTNRERSTRRFQHEREAIRALIRPCDAETGAQRVLIARPHGLEDSSRYWSVWMTLDHLRIVHHSFVRVIRALTEGIVPPGRANTADVKPSPNVTPVVAADYEQSCDEYLAVVREASDLNTLVRYAHPWFGPLNAAGWHALSGGHLRIHRVQIERILAGLLAASAPPFRPPCSQRASLRRR
jgi:hypothetical protein